MLSKSVIYSGLLFGVLVPFSTKYSNAGLILFYILSCALIIKNFHSERLVKHKCFLISTVLLVAPIILGFIVFGLQNSIVQMLGRRITLIISPLIMFMLSREVLKELKDKAMLGLILGGFLTSAYLIFTVFERFLSEKGAWVIDKDLFNYYHTNVNFMSGIDIHPSYYGVYIVVALICVQSQVLIKNRYLKFFISLVFILSLVFVNSRILLFLLFLFITWIIVKGMTTKLVSNSQRLFAVVIGVILVTILFRTFKDTYIYHKFSHELAWDLSNEVGTKYNSKNQGDSRLARWQTAIEIIKKKPLLGYGAGKETEILKKEYLKKGMKASAKFEYNSHNQYITTFIEGGIFSFLLFIGFFIANLCLAWKKDDTLYLFFLITVITICSVESYFNRNAGISFFSFFSTIFLLSNGTSKAEHN